MTARRPAASTNPFRKSVSNPSQTTTIASSPTTAASIFDSPEQPKPHSILHTSRSPSAGQSKPTKKVRVQSPPSSPEPSRPPSPQHQAHEIELKEELEEQEKNEAWPIKLHILDGEPAMLADAPQADGLGPFEDATDRLERQDEPTEIETAGAHRPAAQQSPGRAPPNPFSRTLQDMEPHGRDGRAATTSQDAAKSLDVGAFKRLLLTGVAAPLSPDDADTTGATNSKAPVVAAPPVPASRKPKPPPPPPARQSRYSRPESRDLGKPSLGVSDTSSPGKSLRDVQKPLPLPPTSRRNSDTSPPGQEAEAPSLADAGLPPTLTGVSSPPAKPPLPRKQSRSEAPKPAPPLAPASVEGDTASSVGSNVAERRASMESIRSRAESIRGPQTPAPAPPPPRRLGSRKSVSLAPEVAIPRRNPSPSPSAAPSDAERSPVLLSPIMLSPAVGPTGSSSPLSQRSMESIRSVANLGSLAATGTAATLAQSPMAPPPPPPARSNTIRTSRPSSRHEGSGPSRESLPPPPPPPPTRQRGGNRSSLDGATGSGKKLAAAMDLTKQPPTPGETAIKEEEGHGTNILADLEVLQKELDAYRGKP